MNKIKDLHRSVNRAKTQGYWCREDENAFCGVLCTKNGLKWVHFIDQLVVHMQVVVGCVDVHSPECLEKYGYNILDYYSYNATEVELKKMPKKYMGLLKPKRTLKHSLVQTKKDSSAAFSQLFEAIAELDKEFPAEALKYNNRIRKVL